MLGGSRETYVRYKNDSTTCGELAKNMGIISPPSLELRTDEVVCAPNPRFTLMIVSRTDQMIG